MAFIPRKTFGEELLEQANNLSAWNKERKDEDRLNEELRYVKDKRNAEDMYLKDKRNKEDSYIEEGRKKKAAREAELDQLQRDLLDYKPSKAGGPALGPILGPVKQDFKPWMPSSISTDIDKGVQALNQKEEDRYALARIKARIAQLSGKNPEASPEDYLREWEDKELSEKDKKSKQGQLDRAFEENKRQFDESMNLDWFKARQSKETNDAFKQEKMEQEAFNKGSDRVTKATKLMESSGLSRLVSNIEMFDSALREHTSKGLADAKDAPGIGGLSNMPLADWTQSAMGNKGFTSLKQLKQSIMNMDLKALSGSAVASSEAIRYIKTIMDKPGIPASVVLDGLRNVSLAAQKDMGLFEGPIMNVAEGDRAGAYAKDVYLKTVGEPYKDRLNRINTPEIEEDDPIQKIKAMRGQKAKSVADRIYGK